MNGDKFMHAFKEFKKIDRKQFDLSSTNLNNLVSYE